MFFLFFFFFVFLVISYSGFETKNDQNGGNNNDFGAGFIVGMVFGCIFIVGIFGFIYYWFFHSGKNMDDLKSKFCNSNKKSKSKSIEMAKPEFVAQSSNTFSSVTNEPMDFPKFMPEGDIVKETDEIPTPGTTPGTLN